jgi:hypothetical protein
MQELEKQRAMKSKRKVDLQNRRSAAFKQRMRLVMQQANEDEVCIVLHREHKILRVAKGQHPICKISRIGKWETWIGN